MHPPVFLVCSGAPAVVSLLGSNPTRLWLFANAPQKGTPFYSVPYATWQIIDGSPENYLDKVPDIDMQAVQIDAYADTADEAREVAKALRDAIEPHAHVAVWRGEEYERDTKLYRYSFDVDWWVPR